MTEETSTVTLSARDRAILTGLAAGLNTRYIASRQHVSERTVKQGIHELLLRSHTKNRTHLVAFALRQGLIP